MERPPRDLRRHERVHVCRRAAVSVAGRGPGILQQALQERLPLATSAEVLQELLHAYVPVGRLGTLDTACTFAESAATVWAVEPDDVRHARDLAGTQPQLGARELLHLACCRRRRVHEVRTCDRAFAAAFSR